LLRNQRERLFMGPSPFLLTLRIKTLLLEACMYSGPFMLELRDCSDGRLVALRCSGRASETGELGWGGISCTTVEASAPWSLGWLMMAIGRSIERRSRLEKGGWRMQRERDRSVAAEDG
jgi:hypothetical protein